MKSLFGVLLITLIVSQGAAAAEAEHLIYLHGAIVENQGLPAVHPVFGEYAFDDIVAALTDSGFVVHAEVRSRTTDPWVPARSVAAEIETGLQHGFLYQPFDAWLAPAVSWAHSGGI